MTYIQEKQINDKPAFNKEDWASAYKNVEKELTNEPLNTIKGGDIDELNGTLFRNCLLYTSPSPRDLSTSRMPSSA